MTANRKTVSKREAAGQEPGPRRRPGLLFYTITIAALVILVVLGSWQVRRLEWKENLIATIEQRMRGAPLTLDEALALWRNTGDVDYVPVRLSGVFDHTKEQDYLATHQGASGWYLYAPLTTSDGKAIIVNRGFVPYDLKDASDRSWKPVDGPVEFVALARNPLFEKPGWVVPDNDPANATWYWKDMPAMAAAMDLDPETVTPFFADVALSDAPPAEGPIAGVTRVNLPNNHLQYVITWFGLAAALVLVAGYYVWRARNEKD